MWSLGITFFEILIGRTPFEHSDTEQFSTKEDLEKYWARTVSLTFRVFAHMLTSPIYSASREMGWELEDVQSHRETPPKDDFAQR